MEIEMSDERSITNRRVTIRDVAARAEVDVSLVSRVLNNNPKASAAPATRERILEAARTLGYQPNVVARGLRMARTWTLGLVLPNLSNPMYAEIIRSAELRARERGFGLVFGTHVDGQEDETFTRILQQGRVDGLLTASGIHGDAFLRSVANGGHGPLVMLNRRMRGVRPTVTVDDAAGAALAMQHFVELGHTRRRGHLRPERDRHHHPPPQGIRRCRRGGRHRRGSHQHPWRRRRGRQLRRGADLPRASAMSPPSSPRPSPSAWA